MQLQKNERGYWYVTIPSGPHDSRAVRVWIHQTLVPPPSCPMEGQVIEPTNLEMSGTWVVRCPRCSWSDDALPSRERPPAETHPTRSRYISWPVRGAAIRRTERGSLVLVPGDGTVYLARVVSGHRGSARIDEIRGGVVWAQGSELHSPQGNLGCTAWALVQAPTDTPIEMYGERSGRRVPGGRESVRQRLHPDGRTEEILEAEIEDLLR